MALSQPQLPKTPLDPIPPSPLLTPLDPVPHAVPITPIVNPLKPWYKRLLPDLSHLRNPGKFEEYSREAQEITTTQEYFDGMKFEFARALSENFMVSHALHMGSSDANGGGTYSFCPQMSSRNKKTAVMGRFDGDGRVMGRLAHAFTPNLAFTGVAQVSAEQAMMTMEATYAGSSWTGSAKLEGSSVVELTMMQAISARASVGVQVLHIPQPQAAITGLAWAGRLWSGSEITKQFTQQRVPRWVLAGQIGTLVPLHAAFTYHTPYKADFATELAYQMKQDGGVEPVWCAAALYSFAGGRVKVRCDSKVRVGVYIEEGVSQNMSAFLCGDLDHRQNKYKFGFGITLQS